MNEIVRFDALLSGRTLHEVLSYHQLEPQQLAGKTVLDLGCGHSDLQRDLDDYGISARVLGIDGSVEQLQHPTRTQKVLADIGDQLPVADRSVDIVLTTYALPMWAQTTEQISTFFGESKRVLKPKGILSIYPHLVAKPFGRNKIPEKEIGRMRRAAITEERKIKFSLNWSAVLVEDDDLLQVIKRR